MSFFWGQNFRSLARKSVFCYRTPDFVNGPFVALGDSFDVAPSDPFLNFSFPSYGRFREGDPPTQQKVLPHLTVGALTDSNSPSARSALALRARALRARAGKTIFYGFPYISLFSPLQPLSATTRRLKYSPMIRSSSFLTKRFLMKIPKNSIIYLLVGKWGNQQLFLTGLAEFM